ncbi:hypothetical protein V3C99_016130 [Haemonchus contortus]
MLAFFLLLVLDLQSVVAQVDLLPEESKDTFETLNMLYSDNLEWSYEWAEKALEYLKLPDSVKADLVIKGKQSFPADDTQLLWQKLLAFLEPRFDKKEKAVGYELPDLIRIVSSEIQSMYNERLIDGWQLDFVKLERLPAGTIYGCNGFIDGKGNKDVISAACLYKKP